MAARICGQAIKPITTKRMTPSAPGTQPKLLLTFLEVTPAVGLTVATALTVGLALMTTAAVGRVAVGEAVTAFSTVPLITTLMAVGTAVGLVLPVVLPVTTPPLFAVLLELVTAALGA